MSVRTVVVAYPGFAATAAARDAGLDDATPVAVVRDGYVIAARAHGVRPGLRRRQAEAACAGLVFMDDDPARDVRAFEPIVVALEAIVPAVEIVRPGVAAFGARGPARYYGSEAALAQRVVDATGGEGNVGIADGFFAAEQAALRGTIVPPNQTVAFVATLPVAAFGDDDLASELRRLGIRTIGDFAKLPAAAVLARFGTYGAWAHRTARGVEDEPLFPREAPPDFSASMELDPPADRIDVVAFAVRSLTAELSNRLATRGLACAQIAIEASTTWGETLSRRWRNDRLDPEALAQCVRWQLEAWLVARADLIRLRPNEGLRVLRLIPEELHPARGRQLALDDRTTARDEQMDRILVRLQGTLGEHAVTTAEIVGGRTPRDRVRLVPWGRMRSATSHPAGKRKPQPSWPGALPAPSPATVYAKPIVADVRDARNASVVIDERGMWSADPVRFSTDGKAWHAIEAWAGPWPLYERWWDRSAGRCIARAQMLTDDGRALLLSFAHGRWFCDGVYD
jgi:protein ImuB